MDLTLTEAWALWWSGQQLTDHTLHGLSVLWLGRTGKLFAFLAGTTIVLDVIGSERILAWGEQLQTNTRIPKNVAVIMTMPLAGSLMVLFDTRENLGQMLLALAVYVAAMGGGLFYERVLRYLTLGFGQLLAMPRFERWLRIIAVPLFFTGFALDYLAS